MPPPVGLSAVSLFAGLDERRLKALEDLGEERDYGGGEEIVGEGEKVRALFVVLSGRVRLDQSSPAGREQTAAEFEPGDPFCLCSAFGGQDFPGRAVAVVESRVLAIGAGELERLAKSDPGISWPLLMAFSRRLCQCMRQVRSLGLKEIPERAAAYVLGELGRLPPGTSEIRLPMTHRDLARSLGTTPETLSRSFRRMAEQGLVRVQGRTISVMDESGLRALANEA